MIDTFFLIADIIGITFFAISGILIAIKQQLDLLGLLITAFLTALGGGIVRDAIMHRYPISFIEIYPALTVLITLLLFFLLRLHRREQLERRLFFVVSDTLGLVAFSIAGGLVAIQAGLNLFGVVVLAFTTAVGGGIIRDVLINQLPQVLISDFYGSIAVVAALQLWVLRYFGAINSYSLLAVALLTSALRLLAYYRGWHLPKIS